MAYLWDRVRVRGGAYGAFCSLDRFAGQAVFVSYRDPNTTATLDVFRQAGRFLQETTLSDEEMTRAVIGAMTLPQAEGIAVPSQVHYVGLGLDLTKVGWTFDGADLVASRHLRMVGESKIPPWATLRNSCRWSG